MSERLERRVEALERALTDDEGDADAFVDGAVTAGRLDTLEARVDELTDRVDELDAAVQAVRGYVGEVRSVNTEVEERADLALSRVEDLEADLERLRERAAPEGTADPGACDRCGRSRSPGEGATDADAGAVTGGATTAAREGPDTNGWAPVDPATDPRPAADGSGPDTGAGYPDVPSSADLQTVHEESADGSEPGGGPLARLRRLVG